MAAALLVVGVGLAGGSAAGAVEKGADQTGTATTQALPAATMAALPGAWTLTTDWGCDGSITGSFAITFNANGTWSSGTYSGWWFQVGDMVVWTFSDVANLVYSGNMSGSWITGIQGYTASGGTKGCFGGNMSNVAARAPASAGTDGAILGR